MAELYLFCPKCDALICGAEHCPTCGWRARRSAGVGEVLKITEIKTRPASPRCITTLAGNSLVVPTSASEILFVSDAQVKGSPLPPNTCASGVMSDSGIVFCATNDLRSISDDNKALMAFAPDSGETLWQFPIKAHSLSLPSAREGVLYIAANNGLLWAIDAQTRHPVWAKPCSIPTPSPEAPLIVPANNKCPALVIPATRARTLTAINAKTGAPAWKKPFEPETDKQQDWFPLTAATDGELVFAACWNGTLYALRAEDGSLVWKQKLGRGITSGVAVANGRALVGVKDYAPDGMPKTRAHALYALDCRTGELTGRFETARGDARAHIELTPLASEKFIAICTDARQLIALEPSSLEELWRHSFDGEIAAPPVMDDQQILCVIHGDETPGEQGNSLFGSTTLNTVPPLAKVVALRHTAARPPEQLPPATYLERGEFAQAALAFGQMGDLGGAGRVYEQNLRDTKHARVLYEQAGDALNAARMAEAEGQIESANKLLAQAGRADLQAALWVRAGKPEQAADIYEGMASDSQDKGDISGANEFFALAAAQYEAAERFTKAAGIFEKAGKNQDRYRCLIASNELDKLAEVMLSNKDYASAAGYYIQLKRWADAGRMYELAGDHAKSGAYYLQGQKFDEAADQFEQAKDFSGAAQALIQGAPSTEPETAFVTRWTRVAGLFKTVKPPDFEQAAQAYGRISARFDTRKDPHETPPVSSSYLQYRGMEARAWLARAGAAETAQPDQHLASAAAYYEKARGAFSDVDEVDSAAMCEDRRLFHLELPRLEAVGQGNFVQGGSEMLPVVVRNTGYGNARRIWIKISGPAIKIEEATTDNRIAMLEAGKEDSRPFFVRVNDDVYGTVPVQIELRYFDAQGNEKVMIRSDIPIHVKRKDETHHGDTRPQIIVMNGGNIVNASEYQQGDRVSVERKTS